MASFQDSLGKSEPGSQIVLDFAKQQMTQAVATIRILQDVQSSSSQVTTNVPVLIFVPQLSTY